MQLQRAVVAGGTGFVGQHLVRELLAQGTKVTVLTRQPDDRRGFPGDVELRKWSPTGPTTDDDGVEAVAGIVSGADVVVNLAGAPIARKWTRKVRQDILSSRVGAALMLTRAFSALGPGERPPAIISASGVGIYDASDTHAGPLNELSRAGDDGDVCQQWEAATAPLGGLTRLVTLRFGLVLGIEGGVLPSMLPVFRFGFGGTFGNGEQSVSWIHIDDVVQMILRAATDSTISGVFNATSPSPCTMHEFTQTLAKALDKPHWLQVPKPVLSMILGEAAQSILQGTKVQPVRWLDHGFVFNHPRLDEALQDVVKPLI